jgi:hypothetical protein
MRTQDNVGVVVEAYKILANAVNYYKFITRTEKAALMDLLAYITIDTKNLARFIRSYTEEEYIVITEVLKDFPCRVCTYNKCYLINFDSYISEFSKEVRNYVLLYSSSFPSVLKYRCNLGKYTDFSKEIEKVNLPPINEALNYISNAVICEEKPEDECKYAQIILRWLVSNLVYNISDGPIINPPHKT